MGGDTLIMEFWELHGLGCSINDHSTNDTV
jgi:hypothetical protein